MNRDDLADFLARRRSGLQPAVVGLSAGPRRRTAGLRREEVAQLAAMSTDHYTRLDELPLADRRPAGIVRLERWP
ncbi:hypothetical protein [Modestobacter italicus]|uniref:hypothetical protein n=1 Tax=Modestobacter italicus (strain DSM 44449 / CECT 9708 / BC 501) TaxID=2732864 RepID=UPI001C984D5C|nr:hypothetical protein [Modestobacter italicus]